MKDNKKAPTKESSKYNYANILSDEFENSKQFVCFNAKKEPLNPKLLFKVSITNSKGLATLDEVLNGFKANNNLVVGIGIVLGKTAKGNLCGIDIDNCIDENGNISKEAKELINFLDSYTEISISGKGIHILFYATKNGNNCKNSHLEWCKCLEIYDKNRYFTLSGNIINNKGIEQRQEQCDEIYNKYFNNANNSNSSEIALIKTLSNEKIEDYKKHYEFALSVDNLLFNYHNGIRPTNDESSNDMGFIKKLAYWLNDYSLIKEYFLNSPYFAQKDQKHKDKCLIRKDYLHKSILKALEGR